MNQKTEKEYESPKIEVISISLEQGSVAGSVAVNLSLDTIKDELRHED